MALESNQRAEIASYLRAHSQDMMQQWENGVRRNAEPPLTFTKLALRNNFPRLVEHLADSFESGDQPYVAIADSGDHGKQRAATYTFSLSQLLFEYNFLRQTIFDTLDPVFPLSIEDRNAILQAIEIELSASAAAFLEIRTASERQGRLNAELTRNQALADAKSLQEERNKSVKTADVLQEKILSMETDREVKERFLAALSHDLRTPIGASKMAAEILSGALPDTPEIRKFSQILKRNLDRSEVMLCDLLDVSRVRAGHPIELRLAYCDLTKTVTELLDDMTARAFFDFRPNGAIVGYWSRDHIRRMVENLCGNAIKYGDRSKRVTVTLDQDKNQTVIKVHNFGTPIPPAQQTLLFKPFSRTGAAAEEDVAGWGIGLSLVKGVADAHGGSVGVRSERGEGTTFVVTLPNDARPYQSRHMPGLHRYIQTAVDTPNDRLHS